MITMENSRDVHTSPPLSLHFIKFRASGCLGNLARCPGTDMCGDKSVRPCTTLNHIRPRDQNLCVSEDHIDDSDFRHRKVISTQ